MTNLVEHHQSSFESSLVDDDDVDVAASLFIATLIVTSFL